MKKSVTIKPRKASTRDSKKINENCHANIAALLKHREARVRELAIGFQILEVALGKAQVKLKRVSVTDELTKVSNRRAFYSELNKAFLRRHRTREDMALAIIEIDEFDSYLGTVGHQKAEQSIKKIALALKRCVRRKTDMLARIGESEFAVLMAATAGANASLFAERICNSVWSLFLSYPETQHQSLTVSVGIADTHRSIDARNLLDDAYRALKAAQRSGRNKVKHAHQ